MHTHLKIVDDVVTFDKAFAFSNANGAFAYEQDHAFMTCFDHALKVAHAFATELTMCLNLIILSALEFYNNYY